MAKCEKTVYGSFDALRDRIIDGILGGSVSASLEDESIFHGASGSRCHVLVFERYSYAGGNRVSLTVTLFQDGAQIHVSGITSGGSQALFFKVNNWGEETFLEKLMELLQ